MILGTLLELIPYIGPVTSLLGVATDVVGEPSTGGGMGGIVTTVLFSHWVAPKLKRFTDWTSLTWDNKAFDVFFSVLGWITKVLVATGKIDPKEVKKAAEKEKKTW